MVFTNVSRDGYSSLYSHQREVKDQFVSRNVQRYDPRARRYVEWSTPVDWDLQQHWRVDQDNNIIHDYPRFTRDECHKLRKQRLQNGQINLDDMGSDWEDPLGPKVSSTETTVAVI